MNHSSFERPTEHYDKRLSPIDEQICALLKQRKYISNNNPGFPPDESISNWAKKYELYEDYLKTLFGTMRMEEQLKPRIEPAGFRKHLPVLKSLEIDDRHYTVTFIRQYENASVLQLLIDWDGTNDPPIHLDRKFSRNHFELFLGEQYECRQESGGGSTGHYRYKFVVSPPLPDDISGLEFTFKEYSDVYGDKPTGLEISMQVE
ncbi:hypothetical protein AEA09_07435 [Lysinibacillus contaminans]|uniref:Uncharacterized protein n=1 Tax=Lysinibacillus contaminans TaxID=1293441 RepID=A0ABR5K0M0_9BACI|nr:hypothetical protein [Lysinibacillus contaminans]KOS68404.1 hypothetical protein AEA09_07435 [Lysinibacillus contaminans]